VSRFIGLLFALLFCAAHGAGKPVIRASIEGKGPYLAGQQVKVNVTVLVPNFFGSSVNWPTLEIPGATATLSDRSLNVNDTIAGESYAGVQQTYLVVPQRDGEFTLPAAKVVFKYAAEPGKAPVPGEVTLPPLKFTARLPAGAAAGSSAGPVARVTIRQTLDRDALGLKTGDALTRMIETNAEKTQAMMIPPPEFVAPAGVHLYRKDPVLTDVKTDRGDFVGGRRVDRVTYIFDKAGDVTLPAIEVAWFNAATNKQEKAVAPEIKVSVAAGAASSSSIAPEAPSPGVAKAATTHSFPWKLVLAIVSVLAITVAAVRWLLRFLSPPLRSWIAERQRRHAESEPVYAARVGDACRRNDAAGAYRAFIAWSNRRDVAVTDALRAEVDRLEKALFSGMPVQRWNGGAFATAFESARKAPRLGRDGPLAQGALPLLNP